MPDTSAAAPAAQFGSPIGSGRSAILIPGLGYTVDHPLLFFADEILDERKAYVENIRWLLPEFDQLGRRDWLRGKEAETWICGQVSDAIERVEKQVPDSWPVLVGKSVGTRAAPVAADRDLPAIWLTPLLNNPDTVNALRRATAPFLLVGGTDDNTWDGHLARRLTRHVVEIPGADHAMIAAGPMANTMKVHGEVLTAIERFLDTVVWAAAPLTAAAAS